LKEHDKDPGGRGAPLDISAEEFRAAGHGLVDRIADFLGSLSSRPVTPGLSPSEIRKRLGGAGAPEEGQPAGRLLEEAAELLFANSVLTGHPRFLGYIVGAPAPIGALADLLASAVNPNVGTWNLAPMATEIEAQAVRWIAEMLGFPAACGGLLTSGGNMANFVGFLAARRAKAPWPIRSAGLAAKGAVPLCLYASSETHTWLQKAADLFGLGTDAIRWVKAGAGQRMDVGELERLIGEDRAAGRHPFLVVGSGGTVSTGAVDPLPRLAEICRREGLWFHVDAAYGGFATKVPGAPEDLAGLALADSVAVDPHKWLYIPVEAGCALVRDPASLGETFEFQPAYYRPHREGDEYIDYHAYGMQNSRSFRALKVWLALRQAGQRGYRRMIADDIALAAELFDRVSRHPRLEAGTRGLSITTFRYVPEGIAPGTPAGEKYLDRLNAELVERLQAGGEVYLSNAVVGGRYFLRTCLVNFRTSRRDIEAIPEIVVRAGRTLDGQMRAGGSPATP
jgi:glutamate/tyrosine decarboxylase-like PLP-dependent enzyme